MKYPIAKIFYSLKGEGVHTGVPVSFIRLAGCNLNCEFCDTNFKETEELTVEQIFDRINKYPTKHVVITGGEPLIHDLRELLTYLHLGAYVVHLETNGTLPTEDYTFDWIAVSPKDRDLAFSTIWSCNEIKFLVGFRGWEVLINEVCMDFYDQLRNTIKMVMPVARSLPKGDKSINDISQENTELAIQYCKKHPEFRLCIQAHKYLRIP